MPAFRCPICRSAAFRPVEVRKPDGTRYVTEFSECAGCTVMFRDADKFTRFEPYKLPEQNRADIKRGEARKAYYEGSDGG